MPSVIHGGDELTDLPEAPSATENGGTTQDYCRRGGEGWVSGGLHPEKLFRATPSRTPENAFLQRDVGEGRISHNFHT